MNEIINEIKNERANKRKTRYYKSKLDAFADEIFELYMKKIYIVEIARYLRKNHKVEISETQISRWLKKHGYLNKNKKE